ncbi:MAG: Macrolide export ATP-binding/permease protein MacB [Parcubacteria group bacterium GW2011_GWB1_43_66]|nr:MAG: Macrolide export ATP-binding/permease protein MacB [Parcubacteria group bacterium GW2011_GWB1_43_66]KKT27924.1 MAG: Macrolide export ATP-binding/permease protein MacB [Parcubacteria group bacterium GW2011_GWF1_43_9]
MNSKQYISLAFTSFRRNLLRTLLTGLGIVISIASVIIVISSAQGVKGFLIGSFEQFGSNLIQTETRVPNTGSINSGQSQEAMALGTVVTTLTVDDMEAVRRLPNIKTTYAAQIGQAVATSEYDKKTVMIYGVSGTFLDIDTGKIDRGRFFTEEEDASLARVAVLGSNVAQDLYGDQNPVGQTIKIKNRNFTIIGTFSPRGAILFFNYDDIVFMPVQTLQKQVLGINHVSAITSSYIDKSKVKTTAADIEELLRDRHNIDRANPDKDDFIVQTMDDVASTLDTIIGGFTILLVALAAISLVVGGVGIMNIMFVSVLERTFEIGLRKAVGATRKQVLRQFLMEAVMVTLFGGITGIVLGVTISYLISVAADYLGFAWKFVVPAYSLILSVGFSVACGLVFGIYPARRAADLDPIEALRHE